MSKVEHFGAGYLEIGTVGGQIMVYIPPIDRHIAFSPEQAIAFAELILDVANPLLGPTGTSPGGADPGQNTGK